MTRQIVLALAVLLTAGSAAAQKIEFDSITPNGYFDLARKQGQATKIFGTLVMPDKTTGPVPAMVISHGSGGVSFEREMTWASRMKAIGVAAFVVDSFAPRGVSETATEQARLSTAANVADALAALKLLAADPRIDPSRIGVMGFSKGGQVSIYTALDPYRRAIVDGNTKFALHVPLYPYCNDWHTSERIDGAPMLFLLGGKDDYTPAKPCQAYADWFKGKGAPMQVVVYLDAYHGFDGPGRAQYLSNVVTGKNCDGQFDLDRFTVKIRTSGEDITRTAREYGRSCLSRGANMGGDETARRRAPDDVIGFVKANFKL